MAAGGIPPNANKAGGVTDRRDFEASFRYAPFGFKIFPHLRIHYFGCFPTALFLTFPRIEGSDIYRVVAPFGVTGIIFDSGVTDRAVAEGKTAYQTTDLKYSADLMGKVYKIDLSVEPSTDPGKMKTKHRYSAGNWSDYQQK